MGVNTFRLKLLAFAIGAFLAGLAGTVKAHVDTSVTPDQYVFLESAVPARRRRPRRHGHRARRRCIGATLLQALPEKLRFVSRLPAAAVRPRCWSS